MKTQLITNPSTVDIKKCAEILKNNGLVVFPTETVYGLGANAYSEEAVKKIFKAKGRPVDNPLIVHIHSIDMLPTIAVNIPDIAYELFNKFSPGPLTIVLDKSESIPGIVTAGLKTVAIRIPSHPIALSLIKEAEIPVAAPSANQSGRPSPTTFEMALSEMEGRVDAIINGGNTEVGIESTVIKIEENSLTILRPGFITEDDLLTVLPEFFKINNTINTKKIESPGMKYTHYKPKAKVILCEKDLINIAVEKFKNQKIAILTHKAKLTNNTVINFKNIEEYAKNLYKTFFELDKNNIEVIIAEKVMEEGVGKALMNRLKKASGEKEFIS